MWHRLIRPLLFMFSPETAHLISLGSLSLANKLKILSKPLNELSANKKLFGLNFPNTIGLAAGLDKNGDYIDALSKLGFGFIEVGTVTPRPQPGNPKPRLFRLPHSQAIINRMGFNNKGVEHLVYQLKNRKRNDVIIGVNIGKNRDTPLENAINDYLYCLEELYGLADYLVVNISSPNTPGLRELQNEKYFESLLETLTQEATVQAQRYRKRTPLLVKLSPDLSTEELKNIAAHLLRYKIDGVVATNTTITRPTHSTERSLQEEGGLSGKPLCSLSTKTIKTLREALGENFPIIGVGGVFDKKDLNEKYSAGADLVQVYTGFIYEGPALIRRLLRS